MYGDKIYLCNGQNSTPDKRGFIPVSVTEVKGGLGYDDLVNPVLPGNPNYEFLIADGQNTVTLTIDQIPSHTHLADANSTVVEHDGGHSHALTAITSVGGSGLGYEHVNSGNIETLQTDKSTTGITVDTTVINALQGGGQSHKNTPPVLPCYYIIYIP